jgi:hypothetical protein
MSFQVTVQLTMLTNKGETTVTDAAGLLREDPEQIQ